MDNKNQTTPFDATILFADLVDSSTLSHVLNPSAYDKIVADFQKTAATVAAETIASERVKPHHVEATVRGDELSVILVDPIPRNQTRASAAANGNDGADVFKREMHFGTRVALQIAVRLKRRWLLVAENQRRINESGQPPLGLAIGMHSGPVVLGQHTRFEMGELNRRVMRTAEGYAINIAKRVETASRTGRFSRIFLTRPLYNRTPADFRQAFVRVDVPHLKGIAQAPVIYEAKGIGHFDDKRLPNTPEFRRENIATYEKVVAANPDEIWLLLDLAHKYFDDGDYSQAVKKYEAVIEADPQFAAAYAYLGRSHFRNLRFMEAESALERSVELDPGQARANNFLAVCLRRNALIALGRDNRNKAVPLFQRAISLHEKALRISKLEGMLDEFPWAENGLNYTIAHCHESVGEVLPYGLKAAYENSAELAKRISKSSVWRGKMHLVEHVNGFIAFKMGQSGWAKEHFKRALEGLNRRMGGGQIDKRGLAEQKAEILYHDGLVDWSKNTEGYRRQATDKWKQARDCIKQAWKRDAVRAWNEQYWSFHALEVPDKGRKQLRDILQ